MRLNFLLTLAAVAAAAPSTASVTLFSQNFDSLPQGIPAAGVPGFSITGTVDVVASGNFSIDCVGGIGACLDIDGTPGPGALTSNSIDFAAGRKVTISFDLSGNQRNDAESDLFQFLLEFSPLANVTGFQCLSGLSCAGGDFAGFLLYAWGEDVLGNRDWLTYSLEFTPLQAGSLTLKFSSTSANNIGPVLDNVLVTQGVPEPSSWAMLIAGFGLVGAVARRRKVALTA